MADYGVGALGGVVLIDPTTGLPYKAAGGGGGGGAVDSVNGKTGVVVLSASDVGAATTAQGAKADTAVQPAALTGKENTLTAGANITIDRTNPSAPVISASGGGGGGAVDSVNGKTGAVVLNATDVGAATAAQGAKADTATQGGYIKPGAGIPKADLAAAVQTSLGKADSAVQPAAIANFVPNTRTVAGKALMANVTLAKGDVGLGNVDNTSDANKPVSTAQQNALNLKAPLASPAFTGTPTGITKAHVGLGNVDNTSDANKPVSIAQAAAINAKVGSGNASVTGIEYYPTVGDLPNPCVTGVIYATDSA